MPGRDWLPKDDCFLLLAALLACCGTLRAQTFNLITGREPLASLDGLWRFHTGDDPAWKNPSFDDSGWALLCSDKDWARQGYEGYSGMAGYRFQVTVPAGQDRVSLLLPWIRTCYEVYADGQLIGTYGKMPPNVMGYAGGTLRSTIFRLADLVWRPRVEWARSYFFFQSTPGRATAYISAPI